MDVALHNILLTLAYIVSAKLSQNFAIELGNVSPIWVASGICFIWVYLKGYKLLPGVFVGAFIGNVSAFALPISTQTLQSAFPAGIMNGIGDTLCIFFGVYTFKKVSRGKPILSKFSNVAAFIALSVFLGAFISAIFGVVGLAQFEIIPWHKFGTTFLTWFIGDAIGILLLVPLLENILVEKAYKNLDLNFLKVVELTIVMFAMLSLTYIMINQSWGHHFSYLLPLFIIVPILALVGFRYNELITNTLLLLFSCGCLYFVVRDDVTPFFNANRYSSLLFIQVFIFSLSSTIYIIVTGYNKLRQMNQQLFQAEKLASIGELAANVGHEINNPLTILTGHNTGLRRHLERTTQLDSKMIKTFERIDNANLRIKKVVDGLRNLARSESRQTQQIPLQKAVTELADFVQDAFQREGIKLHIDLPEDELVIMAAPGTLDQIILNLLFNAKDAVKLKEDRQIWLSIKKARDMATIEIKDNGVGISSEHISKVFEPFFTTKERGVGTGIGLGIVHRHVEELKGEVTVRSRQGQGASFVVTLPLHKTKMFFLTKDRAERPELNH